MKGVLWLTQLISWKPASLVGPGRGQRVLVIIPCCDTGIDSFQLFKIQSFSHSLAPAVRQDRFRRCGWLLEGSIGVRVSGGLGVDLRYSRKSAGGTGFHRHRYPDNPGQLSVARNDQS